MISTGSTTADSVGLVNSSATIATHLVTKSSSNSSKIGQLKMSMYVEGSTALGYISRVFDDLLILIVLILC